MLPFVALKLRLKLHLRYHWRASNLLKNLANKPLGERRQRLQETIDSLATERVNLATKLQKRGYSREQLEAIKKYTRELAAGLDEAEEDFTSRRHVVEMLNVYAKLVVENDEKVAYVTCVFKIKPDRLLILPAPTNSSGRTPPNKEITR